MNELDEDDFLDTFAETVTHSEKDQPSKEDGNSGLIYNKSYLEERGTIQLDLSKLSRKEKVQLFHRESPEFKGIVADFESKIEEAGCLQPIIDLMSKGLLPETGPAADYVKAKHQIILK